MKKVTVVRDILTGHSKRYGFLEFKDPNECKRVRRKEHKALLKRREILVNFECHLSLPGWIPRRPGVRCA